MKFDFSKIGYEEMLRAVRDRKIHDLWYAVVQFCKAHGAKGYITEVYDCASYDIEQGWLLG